MSNSLFLSLCFSLSSLGIKGEMNDRRRRLVRMAFDILDKDGSGIVSTDEILQVYDLNWHPDVRAGRMTVKEAAKDMMKTWDRKDQNGEITIEEFEDYYKEVSASIDDDDYFELMIRNAWRIAGGEGMAANTANRRVLVTNKDGSQRVETIQHELGMKGKDVDDVRGRLAKQGLNDVDKVDFYGGYEDGNKGNGKGRPSGAVGGARPGAPANGTRPIGRGGGNGGGQRASTPIAGGGRGRKEAWLENGPIGPGDQSTPQERESDVFDSMDTLRRLLYTPPVSLEHLCIKLQVSSVNNSPRVAQGAFLKR